MHRSKQPPYSITSSARSRNDSGIIRPSALAVVRLRTNSNLVGCSTGISPGLVPRRILSTNSAVRRNRMSRLMHSYWCDEDTKPTGRGHDVDWQVEKILPATRSIWMDQFRDAATARSFALRSDVAVPAQTQFLDFRFRLLSPR